MNVIAATKGWDVVKEAASRYGEAKPETPNNTRNTFWCASVVMCTRIKGLETWILTLLDLETWILTLFAPHV